MKQAFWRKGVLHNRCTLIQNIFVWFSIIISYFMQMGCYFYEYDIWSLLKLIWGRCLWLTPYLPTCWLWCLLLNKKCRFFFFFFCLLQVSVYMILLLDATLHQRATQGILFNCFFTCWIFFFFESYHKRVRWEKRRYIIFTFAYFTGMLEGPFRTAFKLVSAELLSRTGEHSV